jgi:hypothetical protein
LIVSDPDGAVRVARNSRPSDQVAFLEKNFISCNVGMAGGKGDVVA